MCQYRGVLRALVAAGVLWLAFAGTARGDRAWVRPQPLTAPGVATGQNEVFVAPDGTVVAAWHEFLLDYTVDPDFGNRIMVLVQRPGDPVAQPVELEHQATGTVGLAMSSRGDAAVLWHDLYGDRLEVARLQAGEAAFGPPEELPLPQMTGSSGMPIAMNDRGDIAIAHRDWNHADEGYSFLGWIARAGEPFGPARRLGPLLGNDGFSGPGDVAIAPDGAATVLFDDNPPHNPDIGTPGPARVGAITWRAGDDDVHEQWVRTVPSGRSLGCARLEMDGAGRAAAQWLEGPTGCHGWVGDEGGPIEMAWRPADAEDFGPPSQSEDRWVAQTNRGLVMDAAGEALVAYHPYAVLGKLDAVRREDGRLALTSPLAPLASPQSAPGEPVDAVLSPGGRGLAVLATRPTTDTYSARLTLTRREPGAGFGAIEDLRADCLPASIWTKGAINDAGEAAVLVRDGFFSGLELYRDAAAPEPVPRTCDRPEAELPPIDPDVPLDPELPGLPLPPVPVGAMPGGEVVVGPARVTRRGRTRIVSVDVACSGGCGVRGRGRFLAGRRLLARARSNAQARSASTVRLRMRFRVRRRSVRRGRVLLDLAVARRDAPPVARRLVARAR